MRARPRYPAIMKPEDVLKFWYGELDAHGCASPDFVARWWQKSDEFDRELEDRFGELRESVIAGEHDDWLDEPESLVAYVVELLEVFADEVGLDDLTTELEESGALEEPLADAFESEISSNEEFEFTGEEVVSLLERLCEIEFGDDDDDDDDDEDEDEDDDLDEL